MVDEHSGCLDGYPKLGLASDHFHLQRYPDVDDGNYRLVREEVVRFVEGAPARVGGRRICKCLSTTSALWRMLINLSLKPYQ